jgi:branched-subunit amino acid aminotransferase/4-amino-4-deoxychorismate lyase
LSSEAGPRSTARVPDRIVWIDGAIRRGPEATLSVFDRGARDGEGLFETLRVYGGRPFQWERHLERLVVSAAELGFPVPASPAALQAALDAVLEASALRDAVARLTVSRGIPSGGRGRRTRSSAWVEAEPLDARLWPGPRSGGGKAVLSKRPFQPGPLGRHKTTSRLAYRLASEEARAARADEALLISPEGWVLEGAASNVFIIRDGRVQTPPLSLGILPGISRSLALRLSERLGLEPEERPFTTADLARADEIFVTNSVQEVVPLAFLEGRAVPGRALGLEIAAGYRDQVTRELSLEERRKPHSVQ